MQDVFEPTANFGGEEIIEINQFDRKSFQSNRINKSYKDLIAENNFNKVEDVLLECEIRSPTGKYFDKCIKSLTENKKELFDMIQSIANGSNNPVKDKLISNLSVILGNDFYKEIKNKESRKNVILLDLLKEYKKRYDKPFLIKKSEYTRLKNNNTSYHPFSFLTKLTMYKNLFSFEKEKSKFDGESNFDDFNSYFVSNEKPKEDKFLGMPRKVGIGVTIGVSVLAVAGIIFAVVKSRK